MDAVLDLLVVPVVGGVPLLALLVLAVPLTAVLSRHPLRLVGLGGAMVYSLDSAVLALLLWTTGLALGSLDVATAGTGPSGLASLAVVGAVAWVPWIVGYVAAEAPYAARRRVVRAYNIGLSALAGLVFVATALAVRLGVALVLTGGAAPTEVGVWDLAAVVAGSAGYVGVDLVLSALFIARVEHCRFRAVLADPAGLVAAGTALAVNATAVLAALLLALAPYALLLLAPVAVALVLATRTSTTALSEHARAQALYRGAEGCQNATTREAVVEAVLAATSDASAAPAELRDTSPAQDQVGAAIDDEHGRRWLVTGPRANRQPFDSDDRAAVATLAALAAQSLARVGAMDRIRLVAERDALTGVLNRGAFLDLVSRTATGRSAVLFCDVDHFKSVNDTFGHRVGDEVLVQVSTTLREVVGDQGVVGRLGGDEFVVLLPETDPTGAYVLAEKIRLGVESMALGLPDTSVVPSLSIGVVSYPDDGTTADELMISADGAMYASKRGGKNRVTGVQMRVDGPRPGAGVASPP